MFRTSLLTVALACGMATPALAFPTITFGDYVLQPNTPGQKIAITISDDGTGAPISPSTIAGQIAGIDLSVQVGGGVAGPLITAIDLIGPGTIFSANNVGQSYFGDPFLLPNRTTLTYTSTIVGTVPANGILAFITLDTTGVAPGDYVLALMSEDLGPTDVGDTSVLPILVNGRIGSVPEPASIVMGLMGAAALSAVVIRKRRVRG